METAFKVDKFLLVTVLQDGKEIYAMKGKMLMLAQQILA